MAYMSQEHKAVIAKLLKEVIPKDWKYSLKVDNHSSIICTVRSAPIDVLSKVGYDLHQRTYYDVNVYWYKDHITDPELREQVGKIIDVLNHDNHNNSDIMTDYFDVGHYIGLTFGTWDKPFQNTSPPALQASA
jgi:hypothetical protein